MKNKHFSAYLCEYIGYFLLHGRGRVPGATKGRAEAPIDVILGELPEHFSVYGFLLVCCLGMVGYFSIS